jgi:protein-disulfide isomerase
VLKKYPRQIKIVFKNFPLRNHKNAVNAALAALAANRQDKFWKFHDTLFHNYNRLSEKKIQEIVAQIDLDKDQFEKQRQSPAIIAKVNQDVAEGRNLGIRAVPAVYVNGRYLTDISTRGIEAAIEKELKNLQKKP